MRRQSENASTVIGKRVMLAGRSADCHVEGNVRTIITSREKLQGMHIDLSRR